MSKKPLSEFLADTEPHGGKHPLITVEAREGGEYEPYILIRSGKHAAIVRPLHLTGGEGEDYLDLDVHGFVDGQGATAGVFGMTMGKRHTFPEGTGFTSQGWPSAPLVVVLIGEQATTPPSISEG